MNTEYESWKKTDIDKFRYTVKDNIRIIEKDIDFFSEWKDFWQQVYGFSFCSESPSNFNKLMNKHLGSGLSEKWKIKIEYLERRWECIQNGDFSSGEKVMISSMRALSNLDDNVRLIIADECESFLDSTTKALFFETLQKLSEKVSVIYVCHEAKSYPL